MPLRLLEADDGGPAPNYILDINARNTDPLTPPASKRTLKSHGWPGIDALQFLVGHFGEVTHGSTPVAIEDTAGAALVVCLLRQWSQP